MGLFGSKDFTLTLQDAPGGTPRAIKITNSPALKIIAKMMNTTPHGQQFDSNKPTGSLSVPPIPLEGFWDTGPNESHAMFELKAADYDPNSVGRELVATVGDGRTFTVTGHLSEYEVAPNVGDDTGFKAVLTPDGLAVWA